MTIPELVEAHKSAILEITGDKSLPQVGDANGRADQLITALRHTLCCAILVESTEAQLLDMAKRYKENGAIV